MANKYSYKFLPIADKDLDNTLSYIEQELHNPKAAEDLASEIFNKIDVACNNPEAFAKVNNEFIKDKTLRRFTAGNYVVFYKPNQDTQVIIIMRIIYGGMDIDKILKSM